jgi:hypothetical protein
VYALSPGGSVWGAGGFEGAARLGCSMRVVVIVIIIFIIIIIVAIIITIMMMMMMILSALRMQHVTPLSGYAVVPTHGDRRLVQE